MVGLTLPVQQAMMKRIVLTACLALAGEPTQGEAATEMETYEKMARMQTESAIVPPTADEIAERVGPWIDFVSDMSTQNVRAMVRDVYAEDAYLNDTLKEVRGIDAIESYFLHSVDATERVTAEILDVAESNRDYSLRWVMAITFKRLNDREPTRSIGMSHLRFNADGKVVYHQDYWDSASGFYQYVPILGRLIKAIKGRL